MTTFHLRPWRREDASEYRAAVDESLDELRRWMNWAQDQPESMPDTESRLDEYATEFRDGERWRYAILDESGTIVGGASLHPRIGEGGREVGFWVRSSRRREGIATAAVAALVRLAFSEHHADRVEIHCETENTKSADVAERLGLKLAEEITRPRPSGEMGTYSIYRLGRNQYPTPQILGLTYLPEVIIDDA